MTSNEDLMTFLKNMEEKRAKEKEDDKKEWRELREKERKEDREEFMKVIDKCIEEKITDVVGPLEKKTDSIVVAQGQVQAQVDMLAKELSDLKGKKDIPAADNNDSLQHGGRQVQVQQEAQAVPVVGEGQGLDLEQVVSEARRTVGLFRIDQADLARMRQEQYGGAKTPEEERVLAVKEYLKAELKIDSKNIDRMVIEKTFYLNSEKSECLFVTFQHRSSVSRIYEKTFIMRKESRVTTYIPRQFRDRARAISEIEFELRGAEKCKTKIRMGLKDLQLFKKAGRGAKWEYVELPEAELPPVDLGRWSPSRQLATSPPPGRPRNSRPEKRGRESTCSPVDKNHKSARKENEANDDDDEKPACDWSKALESADLVSENSVVSPVHAAGGLVRLPDHGAIMSVSGTPSKSIKPSEDIVDSPVFSRQGKKN